MQMNSQFMDILSEIKMVGALQMISSLTLTLMRKKKKKKLTCNVQYHENEANSIITEKPLRFLSSHDESLHAERGSILSLSTETQFHWTPQVKIIYTIHC